MLSFLTPRRLLILIVVALIVSSFLPARRATALATPLRWLAETFATPIRAPLHSLGVAIRSTPPRELDLADPTNPGQYLARINQLEIEVDRLREENRQLRRVRSVVGQTAPLVQVDARVTAVTGPASSPVLRIDRGAGDDLEQGQIVVSGFHLVGEVAVVDSLTSQVRTITSEKMSLLVRLMPPPDGGAASLRPGVGVWLDWSAELGAFVQDQVAASMDVREGDFAVLADEGWSPQAQGFFLGQVTHVGPDPADPLNYKRIVVEPTFELDHLRRVTVLVPGEQ